MVSDKPIIMEKYFELELANLDEKIEEWNKKNFLQRLFSKDKWSNDQTIEKLEEIFKPELLDQINSKEDFNVFLKYFLDYFQNIPDNQAIFILKSLCSNGFIKPEIEEKLNAALASRKATQYYYSRANDLINLAKGK